MLKALLMPLFLAAIVAAGAVEVVVPASSAGGEGAPSDAVARPAAATSLTARAVAAANGFKASLNSAQRAAVQYEFDSPAKQQGWSNLPLPVTGRDRLTITDLNATQLARLRALLRTILSRQGYADEEATRKADAYIRDEALRRAGGAGTVPYGQTLFDVAFFGTPSTSRKWTVQFGGHHLAIHMTFSGSRVSNTPYYVGVEPTRRFRVAGRTYAPMKDEAAALFGAVRSLSAVAAREGKAEPDVRRRAHRTAEGRAVPREGGHHGELVVGRAAGVRDEGDPGLCGRHADGRGERPHRRSTGASTRGRGSPGRSR